MARTFSLEAVARLRFLETSGRSRRSHSRRQSLGTKGSTTTSSLSHGRCPSRTAGGWTSNGRDRWSSA